MLPRADAAASLVRPRTGPRSSRRGTDPPCSDDRRGAPRGRLGPCPAHLRPGPDRPHRAAEPDAGIGRACLWDGRGVPGAGRRRHGGLLEPRRVELPASPRGSYLPISHPFVERLIGTIRREYLDLVPFWNARDLENKLISFKDFYNDQRCHYALDGDTRSERTGKLRPKDVDLDSYRWRSECRGLYHLPVAA